MKAVLKKTGAGIFRRTQNGSWQRFMIAESRDQAKEICNRFNSLPEIRRNASDAPETLRIIKLDIEGRYVYESIEEGVEDLTMIDREDPEFPKAIEDLKQYYDITPVNGGFTIEPKIAE